MKKISELILNPVENLPFLFTEKYFTTTHGLYVSDKYRTDEIVKKSKIGFSGRNDYNQKVLYIYNEWKKIMQAECLSMRLLSGLHAHIIIFMSIGHIGDKVLLLPEEAGGHYATKGILQRLGYHVIEMIVDYKNLCINIPATIEIMKQECPDFIFVDRSEGINYEDFTELLKQAPDNTCSIFDASQYLTNIMYEDLPSPFKMGFDIILSTLHKNFPGPQKAIVCSKEKNIYWEKIQQGMSNYVSNLHIENILFAGELLKYSDILKNYSQLMLKNSILLEKELEKLGIPIVSKKQSILPTHHIWITAKNPEDAFIFYKNMEACNLLVNYRKLPYNLNYGIRMGTSAATLQGIREQNCKQLADIIASIYYQKISIEDLKIITNNFINTLIPLPNVIVPQKDNNI